MTSYISRVKCNIKWALMPFVHIPAGGAKTLRIKPNASIAWFRSVSGGVGGSEAIRASKTSVKQHGGDVFGVSVLWVCGEKTLSADLTRKISVYCIFFGQISVYLRWRATVVAASLHRNTAQWNITSHPRLTLHQVKMASILVPSKLLVPRLDRELECLLRNIFQRRGTAWTFKYRERTKKREVLSQWLNNWN